MLLDAAVLAFIIAAFAGGRVSRVKALDFKAPSLFIFAAMGKMAVAILGARGSSLAPPIGGPINVAAYVFLCAALALNFHLWGMRLAALGVFLNLIVVFANGGAMPVDRDLAVRAGNYALVRLLDSPNYINHKPATPQTKFRPLADVLPLPLLVPRPTFFAPGSIGDVIVTIGACWLIFSALGTFGLGRPEPPEEVPAEDIGEPQV